MHPDLCTRVSSVQQILPFFIVTHVITKEFWLLLMPVPHLLNHPTCPGSISYILYSDILLQFSVVAWCSVVTYQQSEK